jgi:hypothetical protein
LWIGSARDLDPSEADVSSPWRKSICIRRTLPPASRRCSTLKIRRDARVAACAALVLGLLGLPGLRLRAQDVTEPALKAAFIYNFAQFTDWPPPVSNSGPFVMCVLGDPAVGEALTRAIKGRVLAGQSLSVSLVTTSGLQRMCRVLYVSNITFNEASQLLAGLRDAPVLTLSDLDGFTQIGGIAQFFFEHGQLRFTIQNASAQRARLQISSKLLALSKSRASITP